MKNAAKKKPVRTLEDRARALVADAEAAREEAEELLTLLSEKHRPSGLPGPIVRRMWEARSLVHDPIRALDFALKEINP